jgi:hypothetical protein
LNETAGLNNPTLLPNKSDVNTGIGSHSDDKVSLIAGSLEVLRLYTNLLGSPSGAQAKWAINQNLTAFAGGGIGNAFLTSSYNIIATVTTAGDSISLPNTDFDEGTLIHVKNDGANSLDLFPGVGDDLGNGVGIAEAIPAGESRTFICSVSNTTWTQLIVAGNVSKVGTPLDNQIGIWTGDGTIEGFAGFEFDGSQFSLPNYSFPAADGAADQILSTDGLGVLSFKDQASGGGGLLSATYLFDTDTTAGDPGPGNVRFNNVTPASVTEIFIDAIDENAVDVTNLLSLITTGDRLYIQTKEDASEFLVFDVTAPITDNTGWFTIAGTVQASGGLPADGEPALVILQIGGSVSGGGDVFKVGTPVNNQIGVWTGDGTIEGDAGLTWDGNQVLVPQDNDAVAPTYAFGDGDTGFFESTDDFLNVSVGGTSRFEWVGNTFQGILTGAAAILNALSSATLPTLIPSLGDANTGIGHAADDQLSLVAGGVEGIRLSEAGSEVAMLNQVTIGITASPTQTQGNGPLISSYNEVSVVASGNNVVTLPTAVAGQHCIVINNAALVLQIFPALGDDLGEGVNSSTTLIGGGGSTHFFAEDATTWARVGAGATGGLSDFSSATPLNNSMLVYDGIADIWEPDGGVLFDGTFFIAAGIITTSVGLQGILNVVATGTVPNICPSRFDTDTGLGRAAEDQLSLIAGGAEIARAQEAAVDQFLIVNGTVALPGLAFIGDPDCGLFREDTDRVGIVAGGVIATLYQEGFGTGVLAGSQNDLGLTASVTQTQAGGLVLRSSYNEVATVANSGDALTLQGDPQLASIAGKHTVVINNGANDLQLFPALGDAIGGGATNASVVVVAGGVIVLLGRDGANWDILSNGLPGHAVPQVANDVVQARRTTDLTLTTAFVDVTLDTTDVESDAAVLNHDLVTNTDNIIIGVAGTYRINYEVDAGPTTVGDNLVSLDGRVRLNDTGVGMLGSDAKCGMFSDGSLPGDLFPCNLSQTFYATLAASDFVTLQLEKVEIGGTAETYVADRIIFTAERVL